MKWLSDQALDRLRAAADAPDLSGTGYVLLDKLGAGGMGGVFRVADTALGRQVALKVIGIVDSSGEFGARLLREAKIIAQLEHPGNCPGARRRHAARWPRLLHHEAGAGAATRPAAG